MQELNKRQTWIEALRLRTLPLALSTIITGATLAAFHGAFDVSIFILACITTIFLQILSNLANDLGDSEKGTDNDARIGPLRAVQSGLISAKEMKTAVIVLSFLSLISGLSLLWVSFGQANLMFLVFLLLGLSAIAAAIKYTVGKSAYGYSGLGDAFVFLFFGLIGVGGTYVLFTHTLTPEIFLPAITVGMFSTAVLNLNNMRDIKNDAISGKQTMVVKIGLENAKRYHLFISSMGMFTSIAFSLMYFDEPRRFIFIISFPLVVKVMKRVLIIIDPKEFDPLLKRMAIATFVYSILFALSFAW